MYYIERKKQVLDELTKYIELHGYAPTRKELGQLIGVTAPVANEYVKMLRDDGVIEIEYKKLRGIKIA